MYGHMDSLYTSCAAILDRAAEKYGTDTAFTDSDGEISFKELRDLSRALAASLIARARTGRLCPVMVFLPKSIKSIVSFMGSIYAASPYVPMDYNVPMARFRATAENLRPGAVITETGSSPPQRPESTRFMIQLITARAPS